MTASQDVSRETFDRLTRLAELVIQETKKQNLIARSTIETINERHILDSVQLLPLLRPGPIVDIGSGAGFPGLVLACAGNQITHLVEPRMKRAKFLRSAVAALGLSSSTCVHACHVERVDVAPLASITARAVASLSKLFVMAEHLADENTRWVLPKGRSSASELEEAQRTWQGDFKVVPSKTDADAAIVIAEGVRRRSAR